MSKIKLLSISVALLLVMNLALLLFFFVGKPGHPPRNRPGGFDKDGPKRVIIERLHFDDRQIEEYEKLITLHRRNVTELEGRIRETKNSLYRTLSDGKYIGRDSLENRLGVIQREMEAIHYNHFADIRTLCKPGQLKYFNELTQELALFFSPRKNLPPPPKD